MNAPQSNETEVVGLLRLLDLAQLLVIADAKHRALGEPEYNQRVFAHPCGTPACALGHWADANPERWMKVPGNNWWRRIDLFQRNDGYFDGANWEFALNESECNELFSMGGCEGAQTAKEAADYIRGFVARRASIGLGFAAFRAATLTALKETP
jgi:hypothetical protein